MKDGTSTNSRSRVPRSQPPGWHWRILMNSVILLHKVWVGAQHPNGSWGFFFGVHSELLREMRSQH